MRLIGVLVVALWMAVPASASEPTLLRLFLADGSTLVSFGEYSRVDDRIIFSMPIGGAVAEPRLHVVSIPANAIDWARTERYSASARYQQYARTRGEEDFLALSNAVARVLSEIAFTKDPAKALDIARRARQTMAAWPAAHYGYRQREVREIVLLLDEAISDLRAAAGVGAFDLAFVANVPDVPLEPLLDMPSPREMLDGILRAARFTDRPAERVSLLQSGLVLLHEAGSMIATADASSLRASIQAQIRGEQLIDDRYARVVTRLLSSASRAASSARIRDVESVLARIPVEDAKLGKQRPDVVQALHTSVQGHLDSARQLRLLRDRWSFRQSLYREYRRDVGSHLLQLVKLQPSLDAIKRLDGPAPRTLSRLNARFSGGGDQLQRMTPPEDLRPVHDKLIAAWRLAEQAIQRRTAAAASGRVDTAWEAASAAAGAVMLLSGAQKEIQSFLEPPRLK